MLSSLLSGPSSPLTFYVKLFAHEGGDPLALLLVGQEGEVVPVDDHTDVPLRMVEHTWRAHSRFGSVLDKSIAIGRFPILGCIARAIHGVNKLGALVRPMWLFVRVLHEDAPLAGRMEVRALHIHEEQFELRPFLDFVDIAKDMSILFASSGCVAANISSIACLFVSLAQRRLRSSGCCSSPLLVSIHFVPMGCLPVSLTHCWIGTCS